MGHATVQVVLCSSDDPALARWGRVADFEPASKPEESLCTVLVEQTDPSATVDREQCFVSQLLSTGQYIESLKSAGPMQVQVYLSDVDSVC